MLTSYHQQIKFHSQRYKNENIKTKLKKTDGQTEIDKYRVATLKILQNIMSKKNMIITSIEKE